MPAFSARSRPRPAALLLAFLAVVVAPLAAPVPAAAQFGAVEALAGRVSDLGFFYSRGGILSGSDALEDDPWGVTSFGVELLFEVAEVPSAAARERRAAAEPVVRRVLREVEVRRDGSGADTVYHYEVVRSEPGYGPDDIAWTLEVGIGYGQVQGLELRDPSLDLNATIRTLPSVSLYLSYEPWGVYGGARTGFIRTHAMQVRDESGVLYDGSAEAFMMGLLGGYALGLGPTWLFVEGGWTARTFPSVEWTAPAELPAGVPRELDVSGWSMTAGIQFPVR